MDGSQGRDVAGRKGGETAKDIFLVTVCVYDVRSLLSYDSNEFEQNPEPVQLRFIQNDDIDAGMAQLLLQGAVVEYDDTDGHSQCAQGCHQCVQLHFSARPQVTGSYMEYSERMFLGQGLKFLVTDACNQPVYSIKINLLQCLMCCILSTWRIGRNHE